MVGEEGIEPSLPCENQILSLARLPIPPLARQAHEVKLRRTLIQLIIPQILCYN